MESLQSPVYDDEESLCLMGLVGGKDEENEIVDRLVIKELLNKLKDREREIIILRYFKGKTQTEIAERIGVSQVQISRIEKKALLSMRQLFS